MESTIEQTINDVINKIKTIRKNNGFSLEYMAEMLSISVSGYNKIERNDTNLTIERLLQIQKVLNVPLIELLDLKTENIYHQNLNDNAVGHQQIQNMYLENKEITAKLVNAYQDEIGFLRKQLGK